MPPVSVTAAWKSLAVSVSVMVPFPELTVVVSLIEIVPAVCVIALFVLVSVNVPPAVVVVRSCPIDTPPEPSSVIVPTVVDNLPVVVSVPPLLSKSIEPVPWLKSVAAGKVSVVPAIAVMLVFAPSVGAASVSALHGDLFVPPVASPPPGSRWPCP